MQTMVVRAAVRVLTALGITIAVVALSGRIVGPYAVVIPVADDPAGGAGDACRERSGTLAAFVTETPRDGTIEVFYFCAAA